MHLLLSAKNVHAMQWCSPPGWALDSRPNFMALASKVQALALRAAVERSDGGCGGGGYPSFLSATGWITANILEDMIANEVNTTRLLYSRTNIRRNIIERQTVGRAMTARILIPISRIVCSSANLAKSSAAITYMPYVLLGSPLRNRHITLSEINRVRMRACLEQK